MYTIVLMKVGSTLHGTTIPSSDLDLKGVYLPSLKDLCLQKVPETIRRDFPEGKNVELYSLHYFIDLACEGQSIALDMLFAPESMVIEKSWLWDRLQAHREEFLSQEMMRFITYAQGIVSKHRNKRKKYEEIQGLLIKLMAVTSLTNQRVRDIWDILPEGEYLHKLPPNADGVRMYQVGEKWIPETCPFDHFVTFLLKIDFGKRVKGMDEAVDWKAVGHALRALLQLKELLLHRCLEFPLRERDIIMRVKKGILSYNEEVVPMLHELTQEVETLLRVSDLPPTVDRETWNDFLYDHIMYFYQEKESR